MVEKRLKEYILDNFKTIRNFAKAIGMPESTIRSILKRGLGKANLATVLRITNFLNIDANQLAKGKIVKKQKNPYENLTSLETELLELFGGLDAFNKETLLDLGYRLKQSQNDKVITFMPMISETVYADNTETAEVSYTELPYYLEAASMGPGNRIEEATAEKISIPSSRVPEETDFVISVTGDSMEPTFSSGDRLFVKRTNQLEPGEIGVFNFLGDEFVKEFGYGYLISHNKNYKPIPVNKSLIIQGKVLGKA